MGLLSRLFNSLLAAWHERALLLKAMSFAAVGVVNASVDFAVFSLAYFFVGLSIIPANIASWIVAVTGSYVLNTHITFAHESGRELRLRRYVQFLAAQLAGFFANTATVYFASRYMPVLAAKLLAIGASFIVNFSLSHFVVFRKREQSNA